MTKDNHNKIWEEIKDIRENHIFHIEKDVSEVKVDIGWLKENHKANKTLFYGILATSIAGLLLSVVKLL